MRAGEPNVGAVAAAEKGGFDTVGGLCGGFAAVAARVDGIVVDALGDEDLQQESIRARYTSCLKAVVPSRRRRSTWPAQ